MPCLCLKIYNNFMFAALCRVSSARPRVFSGQVLGADRAGVVFNKKFDRIPVTLRESFGLDKVRSS